MKRGFAAGFVLVAAAVAIYGCQRGATPPAPGPQAEAPTAPKVAPAPAAPSSAPKPQAGSPAAAPKGPDVPALAAPSGGGAAPSPAARAPVDPAKPSFDVVRVEPSGEMVVAGRCVANCAVALTANGKTHESAKADAQGQFTMTPAPLAPGDYQLGLSATQPDGTTIVSEQTLTVSVPKPPSKDVVVVLNKPGAPSQILQRPGAAPADPKVAGAAGPAGPSAFAPAAASPAAAPESARPAAGGKLAIVAVETENGRFFAQGSGPVDGRLRLYLNNAPVASAVIGGDGRWSLRVERGLAPGSYVVRADQLDPKGAQVVARAEATFTYAGPPTAAAGPVASAAPAGQLPAAQSSTAAPSAASPPAAGPAAAEPSGVRPSAQSSAAQPPAGAAAGAATPEAPRTAAATPAPAASDAANPVVGAIGAVKVERGDSLWRISRSSYGAGARYTVIYQANDGQIRNPNLIYPGQVFVVPNESADGQTPPARP